MRKVWEVKHFHNLDSKTGVQSELKDTQTKHVTKVTRTVFFFFFPVVCNKPENKFDKEKNLHILIKRCCEGHCFLLTRGKKGILKTTPVPLKFLAKEALFSKQMFVSVLSLVRIWETHSHPNTFFHHHLPLWWWPNRKQSKFRPEEPNAQTSKLLATCLKPSFPEIWLTLRSLLKLQLNHLVQDYDFSFWDVL